MTGSSDPEPPQRSASEDQREERDHDEGLCAATPPRVLGTIVARNEVTVGFTLRRSGCSGHGADRSAGRRDQRGCVGGRRVVERNIDRRSRSPSGRIGRRRRGRRSRRDHRQRDHRRWIVGCHEGDVGRSDLCVEHRRGGRGRTDRFAGFQACGALEELVEHVGRNGSGQTDLGRLVHLRCGGEERDDQLARIDPHRRIEPTRTLEYRGETSERTRHHEIGLAPRHEHRRNRVPGERHLAGHGLDQEQRQRVHVGLSIDGQPLGLLGRAVLRRAEQHALRLGPRRLGQGPGEAEVGDPEPTLRAEQQVCRLDVAMHEAFAMGVLEALRGVESHRERLGRSQ